MERSASNQLCIACFGAVYSANGATASKAMRPAHFYALIRHVRSVENVSKYCDVRWAECFDPNISCVRTIHVALHGIRHVHDEYHAKELNRIRRSEVLAPIGMHFGLTHFLRADTINA